MSNHHILDNIIHRDIRVINNSGIDLGDAQSYSKLYLSEVEQAQPCYPIFFRKNTHSGQFEMISLFGLAARENLYLDEKKWHASYIPLSIQKGPFLIGYSEQNTEENSPVDPIVYIDMDSPRITTKKGESIFLTNGQPSAYLENISSILNSIHQNRTPTKNFIDTLLKNDLIESVKINIQLDDASDIELANLYTIHQENVANLRDSKLLQFHQQGYLKCVHFIHASMENMNSLIEKKNQRL
ncbi:MAG: hypothetical protein ACI9N9_000923 [Enterobacterales bacterium]|jgi:hypothetical protein